MVNATASEITSNDPWNDVEKTASPNNMDWADFSSANFDNFEQRLGDPSTTSTTKSVAEKKKEITVETDLKLENIEINSNVVEENDVKKISNESIGTIAQVTKDSLEEIKLLEASGDQAKADTCIVSNVKELPLM